MDSGVKRYETEKKIGTDTLMRGNKLPCMPNANTGKSPKTNENLAKEVVCKMSTTKKQVRQVIRLTTWQNLPEFKSSSLPNANLKDKPKTSEDLGRG